MTNVNQKHPTGGMTVAPAVRIPPSWIRAIKLAAADTKMHQSEILRIAIAELLKTHFYQIWKEIPEQDLDRYRTPEGNVRIER